jgi:hypothetical protein
MSFRDVLSSLPTLRQTLESLLPDGIPPGSDPGVVGELHRLYTRADHPARRAETLASVPDRGPFDPHPRTVRASAESIVAGTHLSDWRLDRHHHTFWRLRWRHRVKIYQISLAWLVQKIALTSLPTISLSRPRILCRLRTIGV